MNENKIKKLTLQSYRKNCLDKRRVRKIAKKLTRRELKTYIRYLKRLEAEKNVQIYLPLSLELNKKDLARYFPNKNIIYNLDPMLLLGIKIVNNDQVFELNLRNTFNSIIDYLKGSQTS